MSRHPKKASVMSLDNQNPAHHRFDWPGIVRTLVIQMVVLLALAGAGVGYLSWSSEMAWSEFQAASKAGAFDPGQPESFPAPVQTVKARAKCPVKG
jgi:hypothetical protein